MEFGSWTLARQEAAVMMHRHEPARPPYSSYDRSTVAFRRLWDSRIDSTETLDGASVRHNGKGAGIRATSARGNGNRTTRELEETGGGQA